MLKQFLFGFPIIKQSIDESLYDCDEHRITIALNINIE